jgi:hypothetical protein
VPGASKTMPNNLISTQNSACVFSQNMVFYAYGYGNYNQFQYLCPPIGWKKSGGKMSDFPENDTIRAALEHDLSRAELVTIAKQRGISTSGLTKQQIKEHILKNFERQEGYIRLMNA